MTSKQNAHKRWIKEHREQNNTKKIHFVPTYESRGNRVAREVLETEILGLRILQGVQLGLDHVHGRLDPL